MIDHISFFVSDFAGAKDFYVKVLGAIGYKVHVEREKVAGFGPERPILWLKEGTPTRKEHIAFQVDSRELVDAFYKAGLEAGGTDNGAAGERPNKPNYYGAFILDLEGNNIEAVCRK